MRYEWRDGARINVDAGVAFDELERIRDRDGRLRPATVVEESRPNDAPLHPVFEWRDKIAAQKYREDQARNVIRSVVVIRPTEEHAEVTVRAYVNITTGDGNGRVYESTEVAVSQPDIMAGVIAKMQSHIAGAQRSLDELLEMASRSGDGKRMRRIAIAAKALRVTSRAMQAFS